MSADAHAIDAGVATQTVAAPAWRSRRWTIVAGLAVTETVSWGTLYYAFAVFLTPMRRPVSTSRSVRAPRYSTV